MKHILNKIFIPCFFILSAFNVQAETTLKFDGVLTSIESGATIAIDDDFKGAVTFNEATILTDRENSISSFTFISNTLSVSSINGEIQSSFDGASIPLPANIDPIRGQWFSNPLDFLSEIWIGGTKIDQGNLASLNPVITSLFSPGSVDFRLVFKNSSINVTLMGKINQVTTALTPPPSEDAPICEAGTDPQVIKKGEGTALWWWSQDATSAIINNGIGAVTLPSDYKWIHPSETTTYIMVAKNENGVPTTCKTTVVVEGQASPVCEMGADPQVINAGEGTALWWWSNSASSANIDHNIGTVSIPNDYIWFHPTQTTTYTMNAIGNNGETTTCDTTITVQ